MAITVNTNVPAMSALGHLNRNNNNLETTFEKLSSGLRITKAKDDAAGLAVAENLNSIERSLGQASRNTSDGISIIQVAEGSANEVVSIFQRVRELAVQSSSETLANSERQYITDETTQLLAEVDRIALKTEFNGIQLGDGTNAQLNVQVGANDSSNDRIAITLGDLQLSGLLTASGATSFTLDTVTNAQSALTNIDKVLDELNNIRSKYGSTHNRLSSALNNLSTYRENLKGAESRIRDADFAYETSKMTKLQTMQQAGIAILGQANGLSQGALSLIR